MKRSLISIVAVLVVLAMAWAAFSQQQSDLRARFAKMREAQTKALEVIEQQVAKLKEAMRPPTFDRSRFQNMSDEERQKFIQERRKAFEVRRAAIDAIIAQVAILQGRMQPLAERERYILIDTAQLKTIQKLATKEKATQTAERIKTLLEPPRSRRRFGRRPGQSGAERTRPRERQ